MFELHLVNGKHITCTMGFWFLSLALYFLNTQRLVIQLDGIVDTEHFHSKK